MNGHPNQVIIGVGSNIEPEKHIAEAERFIGLSMRIKRKSTFQWTKPVGYVDQPDFLNGVFLVETFMDPNALRSHLRCIERKCGRIRTSNKFGPRTLDLDIVIWNGEVVDNDLEKRDFLKQAVLEVLPERIPQGEGPVPGNR